MSDKVMLSLQDLRVLAETAERNGTLSHLPDIFLQWATGAQTEIEHLRASETTAWKMVAETTKEIERLRAECLRLHHAEAETMSVVLSQEAQIERLRTDLDAAKEIIRDRLS